MVGSHVETKFCPLKWIVPENKQTLYSICACKYTKSPPYCDATHTSLPSVIRDQILSCSKEHLSELKLCDGCGWVPDW
ncbi:unnamed protein product [Didymodactylos carnosus]|uniref:Iron-binding zinc finger CDGSH type domain-containing protein n=1 Tax=Didymodactylos carnosus TaxID=1234261 RepID=A0A814KVQ0_9BILA|nr:unnamed protein product [Didymodactylos carnosus]CAF1054870.1 unnamed protein product [Didymodactylos carnosus]CAF3544495.1 unnamed protein product [Didymodactylos carnosus]CAF3824042.1 unnamed protein product [Didymodactylos carnosus]